MEIELKEFVSDSIPTDGKTVNDYEKENNFEDPLIAPQSIVDHYSIKTPETVFKLKEEDECDILENDMVSVYSDDSVRTLGNDFTRRNRSGIPSCISCKIF